MTTKPNTKKFGASRRIPGTATRSVPGLGQWYMSPAYLTRREVTEAERDVPRSRYGIVILLVKEPRSEVEPYARRLARRKHMPVAVYSSGIGGTWDSVMVGHYSATGEWLPLTTTGDFNTKTWCRPRPTAWERITHDDNDTKVP